MEAEKSGKRISIKKQNYIKSRIQSLNDNQHHEIFKIIKDNEDSYTVNKNGVFFNLKNIDDHKLNEIYKFIEYIDMMNKTLRKRYET